MSTPIRWAVLLVKLQMAATLLQDAWEFNEQLPAPLAGHIASAKAYTRMAIEQTQAHTDTDTD